jgi:ferric-dicitrate binding protein FerR (iron transport regulator)
MNCEKYIELIEKYLNSDIQDAELDELKRHTQQCPSCRSKFEQIDRFEEVVKDAFSSATTAEEASDSVLSKLPTVRSIPARTLQFGARIAVAASIMLGAGFILGFVFAGYTSVSQTSAKKVPMKVARLKGIVLVKHQDSELWHRLEGDSSIYVGDTFHSTSKSGFILELEDKSTLELNQNSMLVLKLYNGGTQFHLEHGKLAAALESPHPPFFVSTPHGRVEALGTEFTVNVE